jgi:hypothetical protein
VGHFEGKTLVLTISVVLDEGNGLTLFLAVTEVDVGPNAFDILMSGCLHDIRAVAHEVVSGEDVLVDVQEHSQSTVTKLFSVAMVPMLYQSTHQVVLFCQTSWQSHWIQTRESQPVTVTVGTLGQFA